MNTRSIYFSSNRVRDILARFHQLLDPIYGRQEVDAFCERLFGHFLLWDRTQLLLSKNLTIDQSDLLHLHWALHDLLNHRPIQHIIGHTDFYNCRISVGPEVLIPRPETEEMVHWITSHLHPRQQPQAILDLCTGSGCIAIALKKAFPGATVTALDISAPALALAQRNAEQNNLEITFLQANLLQQPPIFTPRSVNLIVANPPYVRICERSDMQPNVLEYEPHQALFVPDDDPLLFYRAIATLADDTLADNGLVVLEINETLPDETLLLLQRHGFGASLHTDFRGRPRWVAAQRLEHLAQL